MIISPVFPDIFVPFVIVHARMRDVRTPHYPFVIVHAQMLGVLAVRIPLACGVH